MRMFFKRILVLFPLIFGLPDVAAQPAWSPERNVEIVSGAAAGGSADRASRLIQEIFREDRIVSPTVSVINMPGGGNTIAWGYLNRHVGDGHYISVAPYTLLTNKLVGTSKLSWSDFTPISLLFDEYLTVAVRADSPIASGKDLIDRLRRDPTSLSIAIATTLGNHIHIGIAKPLKSAGVDIRKLKVVAFKSSSESIANLLGGHVDVVSSSAVNVINLAKAGNIRVIAISSRNRVPGDLSPVPTWSEQGVDGILMTSQGVIAPKGLSAAQIAFWEHAFHRLSQSPAWREGLSKSYWTSNFLGGEETAKYYARQTTEIAAILKDLGLIK